MFLRFAYICSLSLLLFAGPRASWAGTRPCGEALQHGLLKAKADGELDARIDAFFRDHAVAVTGPDEDGSFSIPSRTLSDSLSKTGSAGYWNMGSGQFGDLSLLYSVEHPPAENPLWMLAFLNALKNGLVPRLLPGKVGGLLHLQPKGGALSTVLSARQADSRLQHRIRNCDARSRPRSRTIWNSS